MLEPGAGLRRSLTLPRAAQKERPTASGFPLTSTDGKANAEVRKRAPERLMKIIAVSDCCCSAIPADADQASTTDRPPLSSLIALVNVFSGYVLAGLRVLSAVKSEDCRMLASDGGSAEVVHAIEGQVLLCSSHSEGRPDPRHASRRGRVPV